MGGERREDTENTILVVDDNHTIRKALRVYLQSHGFRVLIAADGQEGVEVYAAQCGEIDLVILDLEMPRKSGREALAEMLGIEPEARVIVLSGKVLDGEQIPGAWAVRQKPIITDELLQVVVKALPGEGKER